ncbi:MAG: acyl-CoA thioesterase/BAAT N-terminal domain-containing protein, partial [Erythrobacter sp.]|uniref:acyl-CoA thioesterase/bile acid-CoA:amino acid N-acyltransferase family protein n=1 Tax=Erythrobacter sp. TaxID=1042 RepID=UPI003299B2BE
MIISPQFLSALGTIALIAGATSTSAQRIEFASGEIVTAGDPVAVEVLDLPPEIEVEIRAERVLKAYYERGYPVRRYQSAATFRSDEEGRVDIAASEAIAGSYEGTDALGLFRSMRQVSDEPAEMDNRVTVSALVDGEVVASNSFEMRYAAPSYSVEELPSLPGSYFAAPASPGKHPVIIVIDGVDSNAQNRELLMPQLVAKGYAVVHFATYEIIYGPREPTIAGMP